jgi:LysM repeat protein
MRKIMIAASMLLSLGAGAQTGTYNEQALAYIRQFKELAISEQQRTGVPAAIKLAQGIHETQAGISELATEANNHFGIKCKKEWQGQTYAHTDDAPNECFRKYGKAIDSYRDHSDYLRNSKRYASCFSLRVTDYAAWAAELKRCGYATNPKYAQKLIRIVEDFHLQDYTVAALKTAPKDENIYVAAVEAEPVPVQKKNYETAGEVVPVNDAPPVTEKIAAAAPQPIVEDVPAAAYEDSVPVYGQTMQRNGLKGFYAHKGDVLLEPAIKYNVRYARILELNDLPDAPLEADMFVYLEKKRAAGMRRTHKVSEGETLLQVAQAEGIQLKQLRALNQMDIGEEPLPGAMLNLQTGVAAKPVVAKSSPEVAQNTYRSNVLAEQPAPVAPVVAKQEEEEEEEEIPAAKPVPLPAFSPTPPPVRENLVIESLPAEPEPVAVAAAPQTQPVVLAANDEAAKEEPIIVIPMPVEKPVEKPVVKPAPRPRPATPPAQKTYTIADELAIGEERRQAYSPRYRAQEPVVEETHDHHAPLPPSAYIAPDFKEDPTTPKPVRQERAKTEAIASRTPATKPELVKEQPVVKEEVPVVREEDLPQDEFSKLKRQLDKAVYGTKKTSSANMVVIEEKPGPMRGAPVEASANVPAAAVSNGPAAYHVVKNGETAFSIARQYGISIKQLRDFNNLNFEAIKVGQKLKVK